MNLAPGGGEVNPLLPGRWGYVYLRGLFECEDGVGGGGVVHEVVGVGGGFALFVERPRGPEAFGGILIAEEPCDAAGGLGEMLLVVLFEGEDGEAGGVAVAPCFERGVVLTLPLAEVG